MSQSGYSASQHSIDSIDEDSKVKKKKKKITNYYIGVWAYMFENLYVDLCRY